MIKVILDTNFLMIPYQFGLDIFSEIKRICDFKYELCIVDKTMDELDKITQEQKGKNVMAAKMAVGFIAGMNIKILKTKTEGSADDAIVELAEKGKTVIATQDGELRDRIRQKGAVLIGMRQKKHLFIDKSYNL